MKKKSNTKFCPRCHKLLPKEKKFGLKLINKTDEIYNVTELKRCRCGTEVIIGFHKNQTFSQAMEISA